MAPWLKVSAERHGLYADTTDTTRFCRFCQYPTGAFAKNDSVPLGGLAGLAKNIHTLIEVLTQQVGRLLDDELIELMREAMRPMSRELAAAIDDCFELADSIQFGRQ